METTSLLVLLFIVPMAYAATDYTVGDSVGWTTGVDYKTWAAAKTFTVGDRLVFTYSAPHKVDVVNQANYDNCATSNPLESHGDGNTFITLKKTGPMYFLCPNLGHCGQGMKLAVTVVSDASNAPGGTPTPTTKHSPNGALKNLHSMNVMVLGASLLLAPMVAFMG